MPLGMLHKIHNLKTGSYGWFSECYLLKDSGGAVCSAASKDKGLHPFFLCLASSMPTFSSTRETWSSATEETVTRLLRWGLALSG